jgi:hypothetical protein
MDAHPLAAPLAASVQVSDLGLSRTGYDVNIQVTGGEVELGIMADAFAIDRADSGAGFHPMETYSADGKWWRQGWFVARRPDGSKWSVTVAQDVPAPVPTGDCGNCAGGHTGDAYCSQSTAGFLR